MAVDTLELVCYVSYRILLPAVLAVSAFIRISVVSLVWLMFFLALPCLPKFSYKNWITYRSLRLYLLLLLIISTLACCGHVVFYTLELTNRLEVTPQNMCNSTNILLMNIGYQSMSTTIVPNVLDRIRLIMPDFIVFIVAVVTTILCFHSPQASELPDREGLPNLSKAWRTLEPYVTMVLLLVAGAVAPSLPSGVYFTVFMVACTLSTVGVKYGKLPHVKLCLLVLSGLQIVALYLYQFRVFHQKLTPDTLTARLLGFVQYYDRKCTLFNGEVVDNPLHLQFTENLIYGNYVFVIALTLLYFSLGLSARYMIKLLSDGRGEPRASYNTMQVDAALEDAAQMRGSLRHRRSRNSSFASSFHPEEEGTFNQIVRFMTKLLIDQVYVLTLAIMMLWSISYISWMEFVLLVLVCFLCICPKAKEASYSVAYPLVGYGTILVIIQYIYGLDLKEDELETNKEIGLSRYEERGWPVLVKAIFLSIFWLHLKAYLYQQNNIIGEGAADTLRHNRYTLTIYRLYHTIRHAILIYWPVVCYAALVAAALHSKGINIMRIVYLMFFSIFMLCYVIARKPLELRILWLWYTLITYSMLCVILLYTYQFEQIRELWTDDKETQPPWITDIGLSKSQSAAQLFTQLLVPILVLLTVTIQLRVFRTPPDSELEAEPVPEVEPEPETIESDAAAFEKKRARLKSQVFLKDMATNVTSTLQEFWADSKTFASRAFHISLAIMEMHSPKFVSLAIFYVCVWRVNVINVVLLLITVSTLPWPLVQYKLTIPIFCWVCWEVFSQLTFQLYMVKDLFKTYLRDFTDVKCNTKPDNTTLKPFECGYKDKSDMQWLGYYNMDDVNSTATSTLELENSPWSLVWGYLLVIVLLVIQRLLVHYMKGRRSPHVYILREGVFPDFIFPNITRESAENKISLQLMYLCNNFFVLFGNEIVNIVHVFVAALRYDVYGFLYIVLLGIWKNLSTQNKSKTCMSYIVLINILISVQYLLLVGLPPGLCLQYPWCGLQTQQNLSLLIWLYLPSTPPTTNRYFVFADFVLLLCMTRMWHVFTLQKLDGTLAGALDSNAGTDYADPRQKSTLNVIKLFIFTYLWWVTAAVLFINAVMTISIFSAGFLLATFYLLWYGSYLLTKSKEMLLNRWEMILIYAYLVVLLKILLQLPSCITFNFLEKNDALKRLMCPVADIFKLICLQDRPENYQDNPFEYCLQMSKSTGLFMDALTFMFVMIQIRVFKSPYFKHAQHYLKVLIETSALGALIMKHRMNLRTKMNLEAEEKRLRHIKQHVAKLKAEHDSRQDFDFGTKELALEAQLYWEEREKRRTEAEKQRSMMYLTQEELADIEEVHILSDDEAGPSGSSGGGPPEEDGGGAPEGEGSGSGGGAPEEDVGGGGAPEDDTEPGGSGGGAPEEDEEPAQLDDEDQHGITFKGDPDFDGQEEDHVPREAPMWTPKPHKPEKPTEEVIIDVLEFSHQSFISFIEFTISWLDDKSGDYRYTSAAIFNERYNALNNGLGSPTAGIMVGQSPSSFKLDDSEILEEVPPSSPPDEQIFLRLCTAIYYFCQARTEVLCFLSMILNHMMNASIVSMFYPLVAFLWGMVAFPRPSGIFWYIVIIFCKISIIVKYLFQFDSITWNSTVQHQAEASNPMWLPNLLGLMKTDELFVKTVWDLLILMSVFFHKSCLETAGIWSMWYNTFEDLEKDDQEKIVPSSSTANANREEVNGETKETSLVDADSNADSDLENEHGIIDDTADFTFLAKLNFVIFWKLLIDKSKKDMPKDLYLPMLLSTLLALLVTLLGWSAFSKIEGQDKFDVSEIISTNYIPSVFLITLLVQFMLMIIDRVIYLKKSMLAKYLYQVVVVLAVHVYLFIFQPWFTREFFRSMAAWIAFYVFFGFYFTMSAFQIQAGYPRQSTDSIILRTYGYVTYWIYLGYLAVPFLWELEVLLNWVCTETTLTIDYWVKYSDIKAYLFKLKCWQVTYESAYYLGEKQPAYMKYGIGGLLVLALILIIWFPLLFMSVVTTNSISNIPSGFSCSLSITGLEPLVSIRMAQMPEPLSDEELEELKYQVTQGSIDTSKRNSTHFNNYTEYIGRWKSPDVTKLDIFSDSITLWEVSPAAIKYLKKYLDEPQTDTEMFNMTMRFDWTITRNPESTTADKTVTGYRDIKILDPSIAGKDEVFVNRKELLEIVSNCDVKSLIRVDQVVPSFLVAKETGSSTYTDLFPRLSNGSTNPLNLKNVTLGLEHEHGLSNRTNCRLWDGYYWSFNQITPFTMNFSNPILLGDNRVQFYIFSERIVSSQYQLIASYGVIGLYISVVLVIFKFVRLVLADSSTRIMFQEMPCPDLIMNLVSSMEMVRAQSEFVLEQVLYRKLLLLYRSPETLIVWTGRHRHLKEE